MRTGKFVTAILSTSLLCTTFVMSLQSQAFAARKEVHPGKDATCRVVLPGGGSTLGACGDVCAGQVIQEIPSTVYPTCGEPEINPLESKGPGKNWTWPVKKK
jgi:hypothetical protein